jgi:hypothetical protein
MGRKERLVLLYTKRLEDGDSEMKKEYSKNDYVAVVGDRVRVVNPGSLLKYGATGFVTRVKNQFCNVSFKAKKLQKWDDQSFFHYRFRKIEKSEKKEFSKKKETKKRPNFMPGIIISTVSIIIDSDGVMWHVDPHTSTFTELTDLVENA